MGIAVGCGHLRQQGSFRLFLQCLSAWISGSKLNSLLAENRIHYVGVLQIKQRWSDLIVIECGVLAVLALS